MPLAAPPATWTPDDAAALYHVPTWSDGYFGINDAGHLVAQPDRTPALQIDLSHVIDDLRRRGISFPVVLRFQDVLRGRVVQLNEAFAAAITEFGYENRYTGVYPIKVNQLHEVVEEVLEAGRPYGMGLECGSKAELVAALPHLEYDDTLLLCNGYKDDGMLHQILTGQRLGKNVLPILEKYDEFERLLALAKLRQVRPRFGVRVRLSATGAGRWAASGGDASKFGIATPELLHLIERLRAENLTDALVLLHCHVGSQIANIQTLKRAVKELAQVYVQLVQRGLPIRYLDVGGGLGVNYEGRYAGTDDGINYTLQEYANAVVQTVREVCEAQDTVHPILISESGRALTAHHSVLLVETLGAYRKEGIEEGFAPAKTDHTIVHDLFATWRWLREAALRPAERLEAFHDAVAKRQEADMLFSFGYLPIEQKALAERLYWSICRVINQQARPDRTEWLPEELKRLDQHLVDQVLCDFSVFQSVLDHWAIGQRFPIVPVQRHDEQPTRRAVLVDLTCDSDGKIRRYVTAQADTRSLPIHDLRPDEPYYLAFCLMGAYQDIMGDAHNLFGRVPEVHLYADADEPGGYYIEKVIAGTSIEEMLAMVQYFPHDLQRRMQALIRTRIDEHKLRPREGVKLLDRYTEMFKETTYFKRES